MIDINKHLPTLRILVSKYQINTPRRMAHFLAQVDHESAGLTRLTESLNYTSQALVKIFNRSRISLADANRYGRSTNRPADQRAIANLIYGGSWGLRNLGNSAPDDGWIYRGRGPIQATGRRNYTDFARYSDIPTDTNPNLMATIEVGMQFAAWFWLRRDINALADVDDITAVRRRVNGGVLGLDDCVKKYRSYIAVLTEDHPLFADA